MRMRDVTITDETEDALIAEVRATLARCAAKGGLYKNVAEERLLPVISVVLTISAELRRARESATGVLAQVSASSRQSCARLAKVYEALWEAIGKPPFDAAMSLLFPGGAGYYAEGSVDERPDRMDLLAELLEAGVHSKVAPDRAKALAKEVRDAAQSLRDATNAARMPRARVKLLERSVLVVAESVRAELAGLRKRLSAEGASEAEIDEVLQTSAPSGADPPKLA
jgi:hypothetical protein